MTDPVVFFDDSLHELDELDPVLLVMEDGHPSDASAYDMIHGSWVLDSEWPSHFRSSFPLSGKRSKNRANSVNQTQRGVLKV
jgi:hypothetical protein